MEKPLRFKKKPVVIEAIQLLANGGNLDQCYEFIGADKGSFEETGMGIDPSDGQFKITTLEGVHVCSLNDYIIKGIKGEFYPCKPDIFEATYELLEKSQININSESKSNKMMEEKKDITVVEKRDITVGEKRVRTSFNPSQIDEVSLIKQKSAELINLCQGLKSKDVRLASLAQNAYEEAAMWAVKAATA